MQSIRTPPGTASEVNTDMPDTKSTTFKRFAKGVIRAVFLYQIASFV